MKTEKLYEKDAYIKRFEARVLTCGKTEKGYKVLLDKTAFFPEGGGQPCDAGFLSGVAVTDVQITDGEIYHYTEAPFSEGQTVSGEIDFDRRYNFMQNHTAEHIVSGLVFERFGFDNIGFHLSESEVTFDFNGFFTEKQLSELELEANRRVWQNLRVTAFYPAPLELKDINYRAKSWIEGEIRLVKIEDTDVCACCAPHVKSTGEIGIIKFLGTEKQHGGTRIFMKCGGFALRDYGDKISDIKAICEMLSAKPESVKNDVSALLEKLENEKRITKAAKERMYLYEIRLSDKSKPALIVDDADIKDLQFLADGLHKAYGGVRTALSKSGENTAFVMCGDLPDIESEFKKLKSAFSVKGGGRDKIRQGSIIAPREKIKEYFGI